MSPNEENGPQTQTQGKVEKSMYECGMCDSFFPSCDLRYKHTQESHLNIQNPSCKRCGHVFLSPARLHSHFVIHSSDWKEKPYKCLHCPSGFNAKCQLVKHYKDIHHDQDDPGMPGNDQRAVPVIALQGRQEVTRNSDLVPEKRKSRLSRGRTNQKQILKSQAENVVEGKQGGEETRNTKNIITIKSPLIQGRDEVTRNSDLVPERRKSRLSRGRTNQKHILKSQPENVLEGKQGGEEKKKTKSTNREPLNSKTDDLTANERLVTNLTPPQRVPRDSSDSINIRSRNYDSENMESSEQTRPSPRTVDNQELRILNQNETQDNLVTKRAKSKSIKSFVCKHCQKRFRFNVALRIHLKTHMGKETLKCAHCPKEFLTQNFLKIHSRVHTGEKPYVCSYCDKGFAQKGNFSSHILRHTDSHSSHKDVTVTPYKNERRVKNNTCLMMNYTCDKCPKEFRMISKLLAHQRLFHSTESTSRNKITPKMYRCIPCAKEFAHIGTAGRHERDIHKSGRVDVALSFPLETYRCNPCGELCVDLESLRTHHYRVHQSKGLGLGNFPPKTQNQETHLQSVARTGEKLHNEQKSDNIKKPYAGLNIFTCRICEKQFRSAQALWAHRLCHRRKRIYSEYPPKRPHICSTCGKGFRFFFLLKSHNLTHLSSTKEHKRCQKRIRTGVQLIRKRAPPAMFNIENSFHTGEKLMKKHPVVHKVERPYRCEKCKSVFRFMTNLSVHCRKFHLADHENSTDRASDTIDIGVKVMERQPVDNCDSVTVHTEENDSSPNSLTEGKPENFGKKTLSSSTKSMKRETIQDVVAKMNKKVQELSPSTEQSVDKEAANDFLGNIDHPPNVQESAISDNPVKIQDVTELIRGRDSSSDSGVIDNEKPCCSKSLPKTPEVGLCVSALNRNTILIEVGEKSNEPQPSTSTTACDTLRGGKDNITVIEIGNSKSDEAVSDKAQTSSGRTLRPRKIPEKSPTPVPKKSHKRKSVPEPINVQPNKKKQPSYPPELDPQERARQWASFVKVFHAKIEDNQK